MSQTRTAGGVAARFGRQHVLTAMKIFLTANWFRRRPVRSSQRWQLRWLVYVTLMMMWDDAGSLGERFDAARSTLAQWFIGRRPGYSYQWWIKALVKWTEALPAQLLPHLRLAMQAMAGAHWKGQGWLAIAVDGTRIDLPHDR